MYEFDFEIYNREGYLTIIPNLSLTFDSFTKHNFLGDEELTLTIEGSDSAFYDLVYYLGCELRAIKEGLVVWRGYISALDLNLHSQQVYYSIEDVVNRVKVFYKTPKEENLETEWVENPDSIALYGVREEILKPSTPMTIQNALELAVNRSKGFSTPTPTLTPNISKNASKLVCRGLGERLKTLYYRSDKGIKNLSNQSESLTVGKSGFGSDSVGFLAGKNNNYIYDTTAQLHIFTNGEKIRVYDSESNDGVYTVVNNNLNKLSDGTLEPYPVLSITSTDIGFKSVEGTNIIYDLQGRLNQLTNRKLVNVSGSIQNDGTYSIKEYTNSSGQSSYSGDLGVRSVYGARIFYSINAHLQDLEPNQVFSVTNSSDNNTTFTVKSNARTSVRSVTHNGISINQASKKITSTTPIFNVFIPEDVINLSGSASGNNNVYRIVSVDKDGYFISVDSEYMNDEAVGANITILAGNTVKVYESTIEEPVNPMNLTIGNAVIVNEQLREEVNSNLVTLSIGDVLDVNEEVTTELSLQQTKEITPFGYHHKQSFTVDSDTYLRELEVYLAVVGSPIADISIEIFEGASLIAVSNSLTANELPNKLTSVSFDFEDTLLESGTTYDFVIWTANQTEQENYYLVGIDSENTYPLKLLSWGDLQYETSDYSISYKMYFVKEIEEVIEDIVSEVEFISSVLNFTTGKKAFYNFPEYVSIYQLLDSISNSSEIPPSFIIRINELNQLEVSYIIFNTDYVYIQDYEVIRDSYNNIVKEYEIEPSRWLKNPLIEQVLGIDTLQWIKQVELSENGLAFTTGKELTIREFWSKQ